MEKKVKIETENETHELEVLEEFEYNGQEYALLFDSSCNCDECGCESDECDCNEDGECDDCDCIDDTPIYIMKRVEKDGKHEYQFIDDEKEFEELTKYAEENMFSDELED